MALLEVEGIDVFYGSIQALRGVGLSVDAGERVALLGANGAGKTTTLRTVSGLLAPRAGAIRFDGEEIGGLPAYAVVGRGIAHAPEGRALFPSLSVEENLRFGYLPRRKDRDGYAAQLDRVFGYFPRLGERRRQAAGTLSGGEQQMLVIARALMSAPRLLVVDELSLGLAPKVVSLLFEIIREVNREGTAVLIVEQFVHMALENTDRAYVLAKGEVVVEGRSGDLLASEDLVASYLGGEVGGASPPPRTARREPPRPASGPPPDGPPPDGPPPDGPPPDGPPPDGRPGGDRGRDRPSEVAAAARPGHGAGRGRGKASIPRRAVALAVAIAALWVGSATALVAKGTDRAVGSAGSAGGTAGTHGSPPAGDLTSVLSSRRSPASAPAAPSAQPPKQAPALRPPAKGEGNLPLTLQVAPSCGRRGDRLTATVRTVAGTRIALEVVYPDNDVRDYYIGPTAADGTFVFPWVVNPTAALGEGWVFVAAVHDRSKRAADAKETFQVAGPEGCR